LPQTSRCVYVIDLYTGKVTFRLQPSPLSPKQFGDSQHGKLHWRTPHFETCAGQSAAVANATDAGLDVFHAIVTFKDLHSSHKKQTSNKYHLFCNKSNRPTTHTKRQSNDALRKIRSRWATRFLSRSISTVRDRISQHAQKKKRFRRSFPTCNLRSG